MPKYNKSRLLSHSTICRQIDNVLRHDESIKRSAKFANLLHDCTEETLVNIVRDAVLLLPLKKYACVDSAVVDAAVAIDGIGRLFGADVANTKSFADVDDIEIE